MDLKEEAILGTEAFSHWYYRAKGRALRQMLDGIEVHEVLDVGAGSGIFSRQLIETGVAQAAICVDPGYAREFQELHDGRPIAFVREVDAVEADLVLMMDVLEHVDDDLGLLREYVDKMPSRAHLFISVPAFRMLWSGHDVFLEHRRRYRLAEVELLVRQAGLEVRRGRYFFGALFPLVALQRFIEAKRMARSGDQPSSALRRHSRLMNAALFATHEVERLTLYRINRLMGLSAFCLAQKP